MPFTTFIRFGVGIFDMSNLEKCFNQDTRSDNFRYSYQKVQHQNLTQRTDFQMFLCNHTRIHNWKTS